MKTEINVDPRIEIKVIPDGEVYIIFKWTIDDLKNFAMAYLAAMEGKLSNGAYAMFRLRNKEGIDYLIKELQNARRELFGDETA